MNMLGKKLVAIGGQGMNDNRYGAGTGTITTSKSTAVQRIGKRINSNTCKEKDTKRPRF